MNSTPLPTPVLLTFALAAAGLVAAVVAIGVLRIRSARTVGTVLHVVPPGKTSRIVAAVVLLVALVIAWQTTAPTTALYSTVVILLSLVVVALRPYVDEQVCGSDGLRRGWTQHAFVAFEEWRLTGEHLRFRVGTDWRAVELPAALHERVEAQLERLAPGRESRFK